MAAIDRDAAFDDHLARWNLVADGAPITTPAGMLLPVRQKGVPAMLKIAFEEEERRGGRLMAWWQGNGAARVLAEQDGVLLLERATGPRSLAAMARSGQDDEATRILCQTTRRLHEHRAPLPVGLVPLDRWFEVLLKVHDQGGVLAEGRSVARALLADPREQVALHGDIHHGNVLDAGSAGWVAIDPKGLLGERSFDYVNILRNPDEATALAPGRFARQVEVVASAAALDRTRLLQWTLAFASLSAAWILGDGDRPDRDLAVAHLAAAAIRS
jgi:streptomycin 6-kinase